MKKIFCAICQDDTEHAGKVDGNGELVFTCSVCKGFIKLPVGMTAKEVEEHLVKHKEANMGQVSVEASESVLKEVMGQSNAKKGQSNDKSSKP